MESTTETNENTMMMAAPQNEHRWLEKLVGDWTFESQCDMGPGKARETFKGHQNFRSVGGLWIIGEGRGEMPGGGMGTMILTLGFDSQKKRFVGTWVGSMMSSMWVYEGELNEPSNVLSLNTEGPSCAEEGKLAKYRDMIEVKSDDHFILSSTIQGSDGKWSEFMQAHYRRA